MAVSEQKRIMPFQSFFIGQIMLFSDTFGEPSLNSFDEFHIAQQGWVPCD